jgi:hypothetical protein
MPSPKGLTINFDSNISKGFYAGSGGYTWTTSGETLSGYDWSGLFEVTLNAGYVIDSITTNNVTTVKSQTDTTFQIDDNFRTTAIITITSKQSTPQPALTFKHFYDAGTIGSGTVKFRHYSQQEPSTSETWVLNESLSGVLAKTNISFTSNSQDFTSIEAYKITPSEPTPFKPLVLVYDNLYRVYNENPNIPNPGWADQAYRTLTFAIPPTGDLLTWLQANGTKQGGL